jgi:HD-GYP domain-containing protein (c-di-GMP phosphodiesterase class II)
VGKLAEVTDRNRATPELPFRLQPRPWGRLRERARATTLGADGSRRVAPFVALTSIAAVLSLLLVAQTASSVTFAGFALATALVGLGLGAELLSFNQSKDSAGSAAVIPFAAAALVAPAVSTILMVVAAQTIVQAIHRRALIKAAFNLAQHTLGISLGIAALYWSGGGSFLDIKGLSFVESIRHQLVPTVLLIGVVQFVNNVCVSGVMALSTSKNFGAMLATNFRYAAPSVVINVVVTFYVAWLSVNLGFFGTAGMAIPILLVRQLYRTTVELTKVTEELLELMVAAIEARDAYTSGHSRRVAKASEIIAKAIGLSHEEVERVSVAALLHDVGKIDEKFGPILAKEGRLTPEEWAIMKAHPVRGSELVGLLSSLRDVVAPVRHHHENWDGTGYPDGLRAEQIPLASRIIMFADTLDAITTDRPYRKALGIEEARSEFIRFREKQFDPAICDKVVSAEVWSELYDTFVGESRKIRKAAS